MVFMQFSNYANGIDIFIGDSIDSINEDTKNGTEFGDLLLQPESAKVITEQKVLNMGLKSEIINAGKESFEKDECSFYLGTVPLTV